MSVMGFQQKKFEWGVGVVSSIQVFLCFFGIFFNFAKPLSVIAIFADFRHRCESCSLGETTETHDLEMLGVVTGRTFRTATQPNFDEQILT